MNPVVNGTVHTDMSDACGYAQAAAEAAFSDAVARAAAAETARYAALRDQVRSASRIM